MRKETDLEGVKSTARMLLMTEVHKTPYSPVVVQHPFTSTGVVALPTEGTEPMELLDITADKDTLMTPLTIDVSTGDAITPHAVQYNFSQIFDDDQSYELWAYNIETVMAEKVETILRRGVFNTRPRDFYDAYILASTQKFNKEVFREALKATAAHRDTTEQIADVPGILQNIEESPELRAVWEKYRKQFSYAQSIEYAEIVNVLRRLVSF